MLKTEQGPGRRARNGGMIPGDSLQNSRGPPAHFMRLLSFGSGEKSPDGRPER